MDVLKFLGNLFAYSLIGIAMILFFFGLFTMNIINNIEDFDELVVRSAKDYVAANPEEVKNYLMESEEIPRVTKSQLLLLCNQEEKIISEDLCSRASDLSEEEVNEAVISDILDKQFAEGSLDAQMGAFSTMAQEQINDLKNTVISTIGNPVYYVFVGIFLYLIGCGLVFVLLDFKPKPSLYKISRNTLFNSLAFVVVFAYIALMTPKYILGLVTKFSGDAIVSSAPEFLVNMITSIILGVLKSATNPLLIIAIILFALSAAGVITLKILIEKEKN